MDVAEVSLGGADQEEDSRIQFLRGHRAVLLRVACRVAGIRPEMDVTVGADVVNALGRVYAEDFSDGYTRRWEYVLFPGWVRLPCNIDAGECWVLSEVSYSSSGSWPAVGSP